MKRKMLRIFRLGGGGLLVTFGVISGFIPVLQGWAFILAGLGLMAPESEYARKALAWAKKKAGISGDDESGDGLPSGDHPSDGQPTDGRPIDGQPGDGNTAGGSGSSDNADDPADGALNAGDSNAKRSTPVKEDDASGTTPTSQPNQGA